MKVKTTQQQQQQQPEEVKPVLDDSPKLQPPSPELENSLVAKEDVQDEVDLASGKLACDQNPTVQEHRKRVPKSAKKLDCKYCDEKYEKKPELMKHTYHCHEIEARAMDLVDCKQCGSIYSDKKSLSAHLRKSSCGQQSGKETNDKSTSEKEMISRELSSSPQRIDSKMTSSKTKKLKCYFCSEIFWQTLYPSHVNQFHRKEAEALNWINCPHCKLIFATTTGLKLHISRCHSRSRTKLGKNVASLKHLEVDPGSSFPKEEEGIDKKLAGRKKKTIASDDKIELPVGLQFEQGEDCPFTSKSTVKRHGKPKLSTNAKYSPTESSLSGKRKYTKKSKVEQFIVSSTPVVKSQKSLNPDSKKKLLLSQSNEVPVETRESKLSSIKKKKKAKSLSGESTSSSSSDFTGFETTDKGESRKFLTELQLNGSILQTLVNPKRKYNKKSRAHSFETQANTSRNKNELISSSKRKSPRSKMDHQKVSQVRKSKFSHLNEVAESHNLDYPSCLDSPSSETPPEESSTDVSGSSSVSLPKKVERKYLFENGKRRMSSSISRKKLVQKFEHEDKLFSTQRRLMAFTDSDEEWNEMCKPTNPTGKTEIKISPSNATEEVRTVRKRKHDCNRDSFASKIPPMKKNSPVKIKIKLTSTGNKKIVIAEQHQDSQFEENKKKTSLEVIVDDDRKRSSKCNEIDEVIELSPKKNTSSLSNHQIRSSNSRKRPHLINSDVATDQFPETKKTKEHLNTPKNPYSEITGRKNEESTQPPQFFTFQNFGGNGREFFGVSEDETLILIADSLEFGSNSRDGNYFPMDGPYMCEICRTIVKTNREFVEHVQTSHDNNEIDETVLEILTSQLQNDTADFITLE